MNNEIYVTKNFTGKMEGMTGITTSMFCNPNCEKLRNIKGSVCEKCYTPHSNLRFNNVKNCYKRNTINLSTTLYSLRDLPRINAQYCRFESHGDLINETHLDNFINICKFNSDVKFTLWTKQYRLLLDYFSTHKKPRNLKIVISSLMINQPINPKRFDELGLNVKIFTVYDKDFIKKKKININCGDKKCIDCLKCYKTNNIKYVNELLK